MEPKITNSAVLMAQALREEAENLLTQLQDISDELDGEINDNSVKS